MKNFVINKYLIGEFLKSFLNVLLIFCCAGLVMNLFEEINYFRKYDIGMGLPIQLSLMIILSLIPIFSSLNILSINFIIS